MPKEPVLYEAMYILDVSLSDEQIETIEDRLKAGLETESAEFVSVHLFGRRRLAYEINGHREGIFRVMYFRGTGAAVDEIKHEFLLSEEVVRGTVLIANPQFMVREKVAPAPPPVESEPEAPAEIEAEPEAEAAPAEESLAAPVEEDAPEAEETAPEAEAAPEEATEE